MKRSITLLLIFTSVNLFSQTKDFNIKEVYPIENSHSYLGFSIKYMGYAMVRGRFEKFNGSIRYDENHLEKTSVSILVDVSTIDTDHDWRDKDLKSDNWFDAESYPFMKFISKKVNKDETGFTMIGDLTIKGITKEVSVKMNKPSGVLKDGRGDSQVVFSGAFSINRKDFNVQGENWSRVKEGITAVDEIVNIEISILGKQINKDNFQNWVRNPESPQGKIYAAVSNKGVDEGLNIFNEMLSNADLKINSNALNIAGYMLLKEGKTNEALALFEKNAQSFPDESNVYDSLGEVWSIKGNIDEARKYYEMALVKDPNNFNAVEILRHLQ